VRKFILAFLFIVVTFILAYLVSGLFISEDYNETNVTSITTVSDVMNKYELENRMQQYLGLSEDEVLEVIDYNLKTPSFRIYKNIVDCGSYQVEIFIFVETSESDDSFTVERVICNYARIKDSKLKLNGRIFTNLERKDNIFIQANLEAYSGGSYQFKGLENIANDTSIYSGEKGKLKFNLDYHFRINLKNDYSDTSE